MVGAPVRNPNDAALSLYYYYRDWMFHPDELDLDGFIECFYKCRFPVDCPGVSAHQMRHLGERTVALARSASYADSVLQSVGIL